MRITLLVLAASLALGAQSLEDMKAMAKAKADAKVESTKTEADKKTDAAKAKADVKVDKTKAKVDAKAGALPVGGDTAKAAVAKGDAKAKGMTEKGKAKTKKGADKPRAAADKVTNQLPPHFATPFRDPGHPYGARTAYGPDPYCGLRDGCGNSGPLPGNPQETASPGYR